MSVIRIHIFLFLLLTSLAAQQLSLHIYDVDNGLPQSSVTSVMQDNQDYLWIGTQDGASRFDGLKFTNFNTKNGLSNSHIYSIMQDSKNNFWFSTKYGLTLFNGHNFQIFTTQNGLPSNEIKYTLEDNSGNIWIATVGGGISKYSNGKFHNFTTHSGFFSDIVRTIYKDKYGRLWFPSADAGKGICYFDGKDFYVLDKKNGFSTNVIYSVFQDSENNFWFGTDKGLTLFDGNKFINISEKQGFKGKTVLSIIEDKYKTLWFSSWSDGIFHYENGKFNNYSLQNGLPSNQIWALQYDKRGDIWVGTENGGLCKIFAERFEYLTKSNGLSDNSVFSTAKDQNNNLWIATYNGIVKKTTDGKIITYNVKNGLLINETYKIYVDKANNVLVGSALGLSIISNTGKITNYSNKNGLPDCKVFAVLQSNSSIFWLATDKGIYTFNGKNFTRLDIKNSNLLLSTMSINEDLYGNIWFSTSNNGIFKYENNTLYQYSTNSGLPSNSVYMMMQDSKKNYWFATSNGICRLDNNKFHNYNNYPELSNNCYFIIEAKNAFYIGTNSGLCLFNPYANNSNNNEQFKVYTKYDGIPTNEFNQGSYYFDGINLWLGTVKGLLKYDTDFRPIDIHNRIKLLGFYVNDKLINLSNNIEFSFKQNKIRIDFISVNYGSKTIYKYLMEGLDKNWNETSDRSITYQALQPGNYKLRILSKNNDGLWSSNEISLTFVINPPFYLTWWFVTLFIIFIVAIAYISYLFKTYQVKKRNQILERLVKVRTKELEEEKDKSENLLLNILPESIVDELKIKGYAEPREFKSISILFTDFKGFTQISSELTAKQLVDELNDMFKHFDTIIVNNGVEKLKTIGDSYMVGAGLPIETTDHAVRIIKTAMEMQQYILERSANSKIKWQMRAGIHSGNVMAGIVGTKKFSYDIWGDTVNIASRMESSGSPGEINISEKTYHIVKDYFHCEPRGRVMAKGKGEMEMYFVKGIKEN